MKTDPRAKRASAPRHHIDAGFLNRRKCFTAFGRLYAKRFQENRHPGDDHWSTLMNDHLMIHMALDSCRMLNVPTLLECLNDPRPTQLFCSTEKVLGCGDGAYDPGRVSNEIELPFKASRRVVLSYNTSHIHADTQKMLLADGHTMSIIAEVHAVNDEEVIAHPLVMGPPTFDHPANRDLPFDYGWDGWTQYEANPDDIDEFQRCASIEVEPDEWMTVMPTISEASVKQAFCTLLGDHPSTDWGGEQYDHFTSQLTLCGKRKTAAFVFKGPAVKGEMKPKHLGKNGDQIYRLSQSHADVLVIQHCHHIGEAVRQTLRAFAVQPSRPRHYVIIDGKDTYRILKSYGLLPLPA